MILHYSKCGYVSGFWQQLELTSELESKIQEISTGKIQLLSFGYSCDSGANVKMVSLNHISPFKSIGLSFF